MKKTTESSHTSREKWDFGRLLKFWFLSLLLLFVSSATFSQTTAVSGVITDEQGNTMPGVNVMVSGTSVGVITDINGKYTINLPPDKTVLKLSFIGYEAQTVETKGKKTVNISMKSAFQQLDEVIAVGYSSKSRTEISSSIAKIDPIQLQKSTSNNIITGLQGKVAGVMIVQNQQSVQGQPDIRIRGTGTMSSDAQPLWVVDGIIGGSYDPNDVASLTVLKDAGATGLYGSQAANGVIVVTTKSGIKGKKSISFDAKMGTSTPNFGNIKYLDGPTLYPLIREGYKNAGRTEADFKAAYADSLTNFDWQDWFYSPANNQSYSLNYSNSTDKNNVYMSANYYNEDGILRGTGYQRLTTTLKLDQNISAKTKLSVGIFGEYNETKGNQMNTDPITPFDKPYNDDGTVVNEAQVKANYKQVEKLNPANVIASGSYNNVYGFKINPYANLKIDILPWMTFATNNRLNVVQNNRKELQGKGSQLTYSVDGGVRNANDINIDILHNDILSASHKVGMHSISGLLGFEANQIKRENLDATSTGFFTGFEVLSVGAQPKYIYGTNSNTSKNSYFSQIDYNYQQKYFVTGSYRIDGSSRFGINNRYGKFWSLAGSYLMSNEDFIKKIGFIDELRLRSSYGLTGNDRFDDYMHLKTFSLKNSYDGTNASTPLTMGNPDLTWEVARTFDAGFNLGVFNRVNMVFDYYYKINDDLLYNVPLDASTGYDLQWRNIGRLDVWGFDLSIMADVIKSKNFKWNVDLELGYNQDEIKKLPNAIKGEQILEEGGAHYAWYNQEWAGVDPKTGSPLWYMHDATTSQRLTNFAGADSTTSNYANATRIRTGKATPDFMGGLMNTFSYKGFTLNVDFNYAFGNFSVKRSSTYDHDGTSALKAIQDVGGTRWYKPGDIATLPKYVINNTSKSDQNSSRYLENGNYLKLSTLSIGYDIPTKYTKRWAIQNLNVYVRGENLKVWTKAHVYTPEYSGFVGSGTAARYDRPFASKFIVGLNVKL